MGPLLSQTNPVRSECVMSTLDWSRSRTVSLRRITFVRVECLVEDLAGVTLEELYWHKTETSKVGRPLVWSPTSLVSSVGRTNMSSSLSSGNFFPGLPATMASYHQ